MARPSNLDKMTYKQLVALQDRIAAAIAARQAADKAEVKRKMAELAAASGFDLTDILGASKGARKGVKAEINFLPIMVKRLTVTGSTLRPRDAAFKSAVARSLQAKVWPLIESGAVRPIVHATFPLAQAGEAHQMMEEGQHIGKIVLTV